MESVDELCQDANKFNNYLRNVARQQQQKVAFIQRQVKQNIYLFKVPYNWIRRFVCDIHSEFSLFLVKNLRAGEVHAFHEIENYF